MSITLETLQSLASSFSVISSSSGQVSPGKPVNLKLTPSTLDLKISDIVPADLDLTWISKDVRFKNFGVESLFGNTDFDPTQIGAILEGGMPARVPVISGIVGSFTDLTGIPGALSQLRGSFPVVMDVPIRVSVSWSVHDASGATVTSGFTAVPAALNTTEISISFDPVIVELTNSVSVPTVTLFVRASVTLTAGSTTHTFDLPDVPFTIPAIAIPTVMVYFLHSNFAASDGDDEGAAFIVVPNNSPLQSLSQLQSLLNTLDSTISSVSSVANLAAFLLGLDALSSALAAQPHVQFRRANANNKINNFNDITLIQRAWYENDTEAEDELSSFIFIGPVRKTVECFNDRDTDTGEGQFNVTIGDKLFAFCTNLHSASPTSGPDGGELSVIHTPPGGWFNPDTFGDELSSMHFQ